MAMEVREEKLKQSEMDIKVSQFLVQISENKSEFESLKQAKQSEILELTSKIATLIDQNQKVEESVLCKIEEVKNLKEEAIATKSEWSKDKQ